MLFGKRKSSDGQLEEMMRKTYWYRITVIMKDGSAMDGEIRDDAPYPWDNCKGVGMYTDDRKKEWWIPMSEVRYICVHRDTEKVECRL